MENINDTKMLVDELRKEWKDLWRSRFDDKFKAEGIANKDYKSLYVDRGLVLFATRTYKALEFHDVLKKYFSSENAERLNPTPARGGIRKFIKNYVVVQNGQNKRRQETRVELERLRKKQQIKHQGKGWLHLSMNIS